MSYAATFGGRQQGFAGFGDASLGVDTSLPLASSPVDPTASAGGFSINPGGSSYGFSNASLGVDTSGFDTTLGNIANSNPYAPPPSTLGGGAASNTGSIIGGIGSALGSIIGAFTGRAPAGPGTSAQPRPAVGPSVSSGGSMFSGTTGILIAVGAIAGVLYLSHRGGSRPEYVEERPERLLNP